MCWGHSPCSASPEGSFMSFIPLKAPQQEKYNAQITVYVGSTPKQYLHQLVGL